MQPMGQDMGFGLAPRHELAVEPERSVTVVEGDDARHKKSLNPEAFPGPRARFCNVAGGWRIFIPRPVCVEAREKSA